MEKDNKERDEMKREEKEKEKERKRLSHILTFTQSTYLIERKNHTRQSVKERKKEIVTE